MRSTTGRWHARTIARRAVLLVALLAAGGCDHEGGDRIAVEQLPDLVLLPDDLPALFTRFDVGQIGFTDLPAGERASPTRFGRKGGWKARYRRAGSATTRGPLVVVSMVDVFSDPDGAKRDFSAYAADVRTVQRRSGAEEVRAPTLGDEALATTVLQRASPSVRYVTVAWRHANTTAVVSASGFAGKITLADVVTIARKQHDRIAEAQNPD